MPQTRLYAETDEAAARTLLAVFDQAIEDDGFPVSAFENIDNPHHWMIAIYCETDVANGVQGRMEELAGEAGFSLDFLREDIPDTDWVAATLRDLSSVRAGRYVVQGSHEMHVPRPHEIAIRVDAGLAFGTGHHGTTAGCLDMLDRLCKRKSFHNILDLGTGSGVLAIAAAKSMPATVLATDIDPVATQTAKYNAQRNGTQNSVHCITANGFNHRRFAELGPFDLVIANILARPLQAMARDLVLNTDSGGSVILSGLLPHQCAPLVAAFRLQGLHLEHYHIRDNWLTLVFRKP